MNWRGFIDGVRDGYRKAMAEGCEPPPIVAKLRRPTVGMRLRHWLSRDQSPLMPPWCPRCRYVWPDLGLECPGCGAHPADDPKFPYVKDRIEMKVRST